MTLTAINADTNRFLPICAIVGNAGVYTVSLDDNCAYNYDTNNQTQSDFNRSKNLGNTSNYNIELADAFSLIYNNGSFIEYYLPLFSTIPIGTTFCIKNQNGEITGDSNAGITTITMTSASSNDYYKCEVGNNGWIVDGQPLATYSQWVNLSKFTQSFDANGWTKLPNGFIMQWAVVEIPPQTSKLSSFPIAFSVSSVNIQATPVDVNVNNVTYRWGATIASKALFQIYNQSPFTTLYYVWTAGI
jgi:hypothetical protein